MSAAASFDALQPTTGDAEEIRAALRVSRDLDAFALARRFAPFEAWTDPHARMIADDLCEALGAPKRAQAIAMRTIRLFPRLDEVRILRLQRTFTMRGAVDGWLALRNEPGPTAETSDETRADLLLLDAYALTHFRDFERATAAIDAAEKYDPTARRLAIYRAQVFLSSDRIPEALAAAEGALDREPDYDDAIGLTAHLRTLVGDRKGALALLRAAAARTQSAAVAAHLVSILDEEALYDEENEWIERWAERVPLLEDEDRLRGLRAGCAYHRGDFEAALRLGGESTAPFLMRVTASLAARQHDEAAKRVVLDVPFVRQHHMTCAPATLTALATYWRMPADHLEIAEAICYDGTARHSQRAWCEAHGFVARELTVTWDSARALLDRGVPFTVAIAQGASAHLQAIVGYDDRRRTLFLRDPFTPGTLEALADEWLETWSATGPYGMVMLPIAEGARIDGLALPDASLHDDVHATNAALEAHDREAARSACDRLVAAAPTHLLTVTAKRALAAYDQDPERVLACARETAAAFPKFVTARLDALACMRVVRPRDARIREAEDLVAAYPKEPLYAEALASELAGDARENERAARLFRRALRGRPDRHWALAGLSRIALSERRPDEALSLSRFAACTGRFDEGTARLYFDAARAVGREDEALAFLTSRASDLGARSAGPTRTLYVALDALGRTRDGIAAIDRALEATSRARDADAIPKNDRGDILLFAAEIRAGLGESDVARDLLSRAKGASSKGDWLRAASQVALHSGDVGERRTLLAELVSLEPLDAQAHVAYASAIAATEGTIAARAHLERAQKEAPHCRALAHARVEWSRGAGSAEIERIVRASLEVDAADAWMQRELAIALGDKGQPAEAWKTLDLAAKLAPNDASLEVSRALLYKRQAKGKEARERLSAAIAVDPDRADAIAMLIDLAPDPRTREEALDAIETIVRARSVTGDGFEAWYTASQPLREAHRLRASVDRARAERPGHWITWICAIRHRSFTREHEAALSLAEEACDRFPLVARVWRERAQALAVAGKNVEAIRTLERAVEVDPFNDGAILELAGFYFGDGAFGRAAELLTRAIGRMPNSNALRVCLAEVVWAEGKNDDAIAMIESVLARKPDDARALEKLEKWTRDRPLGGSFIERLEALCRDRPWSADARVELARAQARRDDTAGALEAVDRAIAIDPLHFDAHELRATLLGLQERFDEAEAACAPTAFGDAIPRELRGRAAWVRARRGDLAGAIDALRALVALHPDYTWGWGQIATWENARGAPAAVLEASRQVVHSAPFLSTAHLQLSDALFATGDRASAIASLRRAVELAPNDVTALQELFDALLEENDYAGAEALLPILSAVRKPVGLFDTVRLRAARGDGDGAIEALRILALDPAGDPRMLASARRACLYAGFGDRCDALYASLLEEPSADESIGVVWAKTRAVRDDFAGLERVMRFVSPKTAASREAAAEWLDLLAQRGAADALHNAAAFVRGRFDCSDDGVWSRLARAFLAAGAFDECIALTRDWRSRTNATSAMLFPAASARRERALDDEAFAIVRRAASLEQNDGAAPSHRVWSAFELAVRGEHDEARRFLDRTAGVELVPILVVVRTLAEAVVLVSEKRGSEGKGSRHAFAQARARLSEVRAQCNLGLLARAHARASERIAKEVGFPLGTIWRNRTAFTAVAIASAVVIALILLITLSGDATSGSSARSGSGSSSGSGTTIPIPLIIMAVVFLFRALGKKR